jgi:hypothetical protein
MKVDVRPRRRNAPRPQEKSAPGYLQWLRGRECACGGFNPHCGGKMQAAHGPDKATKGVGTKCRDSAAMPLSELCHLLQHQKGWQWFAREVLRGRDPLAVCGAYWARWPGRPAWERKLSDEG